MASSNHNSPKFSASSLPSSSEDGACSPSGANVSRLRHIATPAIFTDAGWDKINTTILSTSNCGNPSLRHFGFGPTSGDGFGIGYIIKEDWISICASSKHRQTARLLDTLELYLQEIRKLLRATSRKRSSPRTSRAREMERVSEKGDHRRGRLIRTDTGHGHRRADTPTTDSGEADDDGMGGCMCRSLLFHPP